MELSTTDFEALFHECYDPILAYALRRTSAEDAHDVAAETFLIAWRRRGVIPRRAALPWLYGVARNVLANQRRSAARRDALARRTRDAVRPSSPPDTTDGELMRALGELRDDDREALLLLAWEGLSTVEAARVLGCRPAALRMRLLRARRRLRALLEDEQARDANLTLIGTEER